MEKIENMFRNLFYSFYCPQNRVYVTSNYIRECLNII